MIINENEVLFAKCNNQTGKTSSKHKMEYLEFVFKSGINKYAFILGGIDSGDISYKIQMSKETAINLMKDLCETLKDDVEVVK